MLSISAITILCFIFGSIIGSFLGVCAYRIPMGRYEPVHAGVKELTHPISITNPRRSFCPQCEKQLLWWHNIPLLSWLFLRGRSACCGTQIPFRYLFIELLTGGLCAACYLKFGLNISAGVAFIVICALIVILYIDLDYMIIPDLITYPGTFLALCLAATNSWSFSQGELLLTAPFVSSLTEAGLGLLMGPGVLLFVWGLYWLVRRREGLGLGDVKLLALLGATFGAKCAWFTIFIGSVLGSIFGITAIVLKRRKMTNYIPFGPYLVVAALIYILELDQLVLYLIYHQGLSPWRMLNGNS